MSKYWLVGYTSANQVERMTGLHAIDTPMGTLVKAASPFRLEVELEKLHRALHPRACNCSVVHYPGCPFANAII